MRKVLLITSFMLFACYSFCQTKGTKLVFQDPQIIHPNKVVSSPNCEYFILTDGIYSGNLAFSLFQVRQHQLIASGVISLSLDDKCFSVEVVGVSNDGKNLMLSKECKVFSDGEVFIVYDVDSERMIEDVEIDWNNSDDLKGYFETDGPYDFSNTTESSIVSPKYSLDYSWSKTITISDANTDEIVWESEKQKSSIYKDRQTVYLDNNYVLLSTKNGKDSNIHFIWYDFVNNDTIFSTKNPFGTIEYNNYLLDNKFYLSLRQYPFSAPSFQAKIDLSSGLSSTRNFQKSKDSNEFLPKTIRKLIVDSIKSESPTFIDAHVSLWTIFKKYYKRDSTLKNPTITGQIPFEFYPYSFWNRDVLIDSLAYNWAVFSSYDKKVIYMNVTSGGILSMRQETNLLFWNGNKKDVNERNVNMMYVVNSGPFFYTDDLYYMTSRDLQGIVSVKYDGKIYPFEQFDLKYNRPDIILDRLGYADSTLISAYHAAYLKRLKKMDFSEDMLKEDFNLPQIKIEDLEKMPTLNDQGSIDLKLNLEDSKYNIDRVNVWVNDVAIYGTDGISYRDENKRSLTAPISIDLAKGKNKVQLSVLNQAGAESFKETFKVTCTLGKDQSDLYLITIGESEFNQSDFNLTYAAKDAKDIATLFAESKFYNKVHTKTLVNKEVNKENVMALKAFLNQADINDEVMIFIAGHGVLDADLDYYFATYNMDFSNPAKEGLAYADLESLLDGIKPLKKTLMIDACHSGEIDKEEVVLAIANNKESGNVRFRAVGKTVTPKLGMYNTSELTKSLFTDLRKGTGATVISSAGGMEFAMEGDDWSNGLFTYCFIKGIKSKAADYDKNDEIWLSEIKRYVSEQVSELSNGKQQPTSRIENQIVDFRIW